MESRSGRRWLILAVALFALLLVGWVLLALQLSVAQAGLLPFAPGIASRLSADYGADPQGRPIAVVSLSILDDAMAALGLSEPEAQAAHESMERAMSQPVPTATALNFQGAAPYTATPTHTNTPLPTDTPEPTATKTPVPTETKAPTKTPKPSKTPAPSGVPPTIAATLATSPTATPSVADTVNPSFQSIVLSPAPPDNAGQCSIDVTVVVFDPAFSLGVKNGDVYGRIRINGGPPVNYETLDFVSGGFVSGPGSNWIATYNDTVKLKGAMTGDTVLLEVKVKDIANGVWVIVPAGTYTMGCDCP